MPLPRTGFDQHFEDLSSEQPSLGQIALLPWDTETFGFPVATYTTGTDELDPAATGEFRARFDNWTAQYRVALCSCAVPAKSRFWNACLRDTGFRFVDFALRPTLNNLNHLPEARFELRPAAPGDTALVEAIAADSFRDGRYHADPWFPDRLADLRYRQWIRRALSGDNPSDRVYVLGLEGSVDGFYHVSLDGTEANLRLAAVAPHRKGTMIGFDLYVSILHVLKALGVRRVVTSISAANTAVLNVYSTLGFRFSEPEVVYHWHSEAFRQGHSDVLQQDHSEAFPNGHLDARRSGATA